MFTWSIAPPTLVKIYVYLTTTPPLTWPKSYTGVAKTIFGPAIPTAEATPTVAESSDGTVAGGGEVTEFVLLRAASSPLRPPLPPTA